MRVHLNDIAEDHLQNADEVDGSHGLARGTGADEIRTSRLVGAWVLLSR